MLPTVRDIYGVIDRLAPFDSAEEWDNSGILAGDPQTRARGCLVALDLTEGSLREAVGLGANLIVTHHPILFHARKNLREDDTEAALLCALVRADVALIAAHTNLDKADGGVADSLALALGLARVTAAPGGYVRVGETLGETRFGDFCAETQRRLSGVARPYGDRNAAVRRVAVCPGAGGEYWPEALSLGADCFVTGEIHHHDALAAASAGLLILEAGHMETERPALAPLARGLQSAAHLLQWEIAIFESQYAPFGA